MSNAIRELKISNKTKEITKLRDNLSPYKRQRKLFKKIEVAKEIKNWLKTLEKKYVNFFFKRDIIKCVNCKKKF